ncbi:hypothetical protein EAE90_21290 [Photorhabdus caribbeanensis]|nr:hypothetical protein [Photorhabdus caribbeanensis]
MFFNCLSDKITVRGNPPISSPLLFIPVIFQVASLLAALTHPGNRVIYAPGDSLLCRRDAS